jgi:sulfate-transporting ATPase
LSPDYTQQFNVSYSIQGVLYTVLGGIGYVAGPLLGAFGVPGGFISTIFARQSDNFTNWVSLVLAVSTIFVLADAPDGVAHVTMRRLTAVVRKLSKPSSGMSVDAGAASTNSDHGVPRPSPSRLAISNLTVQFGQVTALEDFSCQVESGELLGIIGPNGAGKTTMIEAATGYISSRHGEIILNGDRINRWSVQRRADRGLGRTFQSLELFEDLTVGENFCVGAPGHGWIAYLRDLVWPRRLSLSPSAEMAIRELKLQDQLGLLPTQLPYGDRRLVALARSLAGSPSLLLLDEPAAGLGRLERRELAVLLRKLAKDWGLGIVLVEHDVDLVMDVCDTVIALAFGRIIASGTPVEVRHDPAVIAAYLGEQDGGVDEEISATR